jgi:hypothetical protein
VNFPKEYTTRDKSNVILDGESGPYYTGHIILGSAKVSSAWHKETMNSCEKPEWDLMLAKREKEIY